jgi:integrase
MSKLTDALILAAPLPSSGYKALTDGQRLFLRVTPDGGRFWRLKFKTSGKESQASLGKYPDVSIAAARAAAHELRRQANTGKNPIREKRDIREAIEDAKSLTFGRIANEWLAKLTTPKGKAITARTREKHQGEIDKCVSLHSLPIVDIRPSQCRAVLEAIERSGKLETAKRVAQTMSNVFGHATRYDISHNPARDRKGWIKAPQTAHHGAITDPAALAVLVGLVDGGWSGASETVNNAMRFLLRTFPRQGELCSMEWTEVDFKTATWLAQPKAKSKLKVPHVVPLASQTVAILAAQKSLSGAGRYVWPHATRDGRHMSTGTVAAALGTMGYTPDQHTAHGFRTTAATLLREALRYDSELVERQLSHKVGNAVAAAYDRSQRIEERQTMMQAWADYLDTLKG